MSQDGTEHSAPSVMPETSDYQPPAWDSWSDSPDSYPEPDASGRSRDANPASWAGDDTAAMSRADITALDEDDDGRAHELDDLEPTEALPATADPKPDEARPTRRNPMAESDSAEGSARARFFDQEREPELCVGTVISERYRLEELKAEGASTASWRAFDQKLSRPVMVHLLNLGAHRNEEVLSAARQAAIATDSRFLRVLDAVGPDGVTLSGNFPDEALGAYIVSEYVPGLNMEELLSTGPLSGLEAAWIARELADALAPMHAEALFHQRLSPNTVVVTGTGNVKIVGFLIEEAIRPDPALTSPSSSRAAQQEADVRAIGQLLYASLVNRWPAPQTQADRLHWGLSAAPMDDRGWLTPRQVRAGVSPALDVVCDQVLSEAPRSGALPITTAAELDAALSRVLGSADASADLEHRVRYPTQSPPVTGSLPATDVPRPRSIAATPVAVRRHGGSPSGPAPSGYSAAPAAQVSSSQQVSSQHPTPDRGGQPLGSPVSASDTPVPPPATRHRSGVDAARADERGPTPRYWLMALVALVLLSLVAGLIAVGVNNRREGTEDPSPGTSTSAAPSGPVSHKIAKVTDFDPEADGGNNEERPGEVARAWDKNPKTAWTTLRYLNNPKLGGLKPGVGLLVDLGRPVQVGRVVVSLQGSPTGLQVLVPAKDPTGATAPTDSIKSWRKIAENPKAGARAELRPSSVTETRYVLVYLTSLPSVGDNGYRGAVAEIEVLDR